MAAHEMVFPLFKRAERLGLLDGESGLVVAPMATGRSHISCGAIRRALNHDQPGGRTYPVPYRALAVEAALRRYDDQALVFCGLRTGAERAVRLIVDEMQLPAATLPEPPEDEDDTVLRLLRRGVAYYLAGLTRPVRQHVEDLFRIGALRMVVGRLTLTAGVNLLACVTIIRNVFHIEHVRGRCRRVLLPASEILNMLGRVGARLTKPAEPAAIIWGRWTVEDRMR